MTSTSFEILHSDRLLWTLAFSLGDVPVQKLALIPVPNGKKPPLFSICAQRYKMFEVRSTRHTKRAVDYRNGGQLVRILKNQEDKLLI